MGKNGLFILCFFIFSYFNVFCNTPKFQFIINDGQWEANVLFRADIPGGVLWVTENGLEYQLYNPGIIQHFVSSNARNSQIPYKIVSFDFSRKIAKNEIKVAGKLNHTVNYFIGNDSSKWKSNLAVYSDIYISDYLKNIDFRLYAADNSLKYEYVVRPGGDPSQLKINYQGAKSIHLNNKELVIATDFGLIKEFEPFTYQINGHTKLKVSSSFKKGNDDEILFELGNYDKTKDLIIDPELVFSSYIGSFSDNWSHSATYDQDGNLYAGGTVFGSNYPITAGAFQSSVGGTTRANESTLRTDIVITKYASEGKEILYSTFLGGIESEVPHSLIVNSIGELVIFGTTSSNNFPMLTNSFQSKFNGGTSLLGPPITTNIGFPSGTDIFVSVLSKNGDKLLGSTYVGGTANDGIHDYRVLAIQNYGDEFRGEVFLDKNDNIYIASVTNSGNFPTVGSNFVKNNGSDAVVFSLSKYCNDLLFSTFLGGNDYDAAYGIRVNEKGEIYVCGVTKSQNFPVTTGAFKPTFGGVSDGFVVKIVNFEIVSSTFLGTNQGDIAALIDLDEENNVYIFGLSTGEYPISQNVFNNPKSGQFVQSLDLDLKNSRFSSVFGTGRQIGRVDLVPTAFLVNNCGNIYVSGWGGRVNSQNGFNQNSTTTGLPITENAFQKNTSGSNYYFAIFEKGFKSLLYGTFFGSEAPPNASSERGDHLDGGTCRFDKNGIIYHTACVCKAGDFVSFPIKNAAQEIHNSSNCNMAAFKFNLDGLVANFDILNGSERNPSKICGPVKLNFDNNSLGSTEYEWFLDNQKISTAETIEYNFTQKGKFKIKLVALNSINCNAIDSTFREIEIETFENGVSNDTIVCEGALVQLKAFGGDSYNWANNEYFTNNNSDKVEFKINQSGNFDVDITKGVCTVKKSIHVMVEDLKTDFGVSNNLTICEGTSVKLLASGLATQFIWSSTDMVDSVKKEIVVSPLKSSTYTLKAIYEDGCTPTKNVRVDIDNSVNLDFNYEVTLNCNEPALINFNNNSSGTNQFQWQFGSEPILSSRNISKNSFENSFNGGVILKGISDLGCKFEIEKRIEVANWDGFIPNIITPNNDKKNDNFVVGYPEPRLQIYDKWGKIIFETEKYQNDWGNKVNSGTYYYLLTIEPNKTCKGWIEVIN
jgi:gliding motility-associated-like protein